MAFSRDELKNIGIDDEHIDSVMTLYGKNVQELKDKEDKAQRDLKEAKQEVKSYKERVDEQNSQLDELQQKVNNGENLEEQIESLKEANQQKEQKHQEEMNEVKLQYEIDKELNSAGAKNTTAVMALVNRDNISFDSEKGLRGLREQIEDLKESDDYLFTSNDNSNSDNTNGQTSGNNTSNYNAGQSKGNKGNEPDANVIGQQHYERLFGKKEQ